MNLENLSASLSPETGELAELLEEDSSLSIEEEGDVDIYIDKLPDNLERPNVVVTVDQKKAGRASRLGANQVLTGQPEDFSDLIYQEAKKARKNHLDNRRNEITQIGLQDLIHNVRNPISVINGYLDLHKDDLDDELHETLTESASRIIEACDDANKYRFHNGESYSELSEEFFQDIHESLSFRIKDEEEDLEIYGENEMIELNALDEIMVYNLLDNSLEHGETPEIGMEGYQDGYFTAHVKDGGNIPEDVWNSWQNGGEYGGTGSKLISYARDINGNELERTDEGYRIKISS
ncbi:MAG: hypothetical protein R6V35_05670 [Candidatus Nanohaloarchaea archaeon]